MRSNKQYLNLLLVALLCVATASCDLFEVQERDISDADPQVEFFPLSTTVSSDGTIAINAQLIAEQRDESLPLTVSVVDSSSSAEEGTHYSLPTTSVTIPADSSSAAFPVNINASNVDGAPVVLVLQLTGTDEVRAAPNLSRSTITIAPSSD